MGYVIDKSKHYFAQMNPYTALIEELGLAIADGGKYDWVECVVDETRYRLVDGYKVTLVPLNKNYAKRDFLPK